MKKFLALCTVLCLTLSCSSMAFAAELPEEKQASMTESTVVSPRNTDYWNTNGPYLLEGPKGIQFYVPAGKHLKVHFNMLSGSLKFSIREKGSSHIIKTVTFSKSGHNYADLISSTKGTTYQVSFTGYTALFDGGFYSEP